MTDLAQAPKALGQIPLLSEEECRIACSTIRKLRPLWEHRHAELPFYTLGTVTYLDATGGQLASYQEKARASNTVLVEHFDWLYQRLQSALEETWEALCSFSESLARPGFHIFLSHPEFDRPGRLHYDLQYQELDWAGHGEPDFTRQTSFTLALDLPAAGAGLRLWNLDYSVIRLLSPEARRRLVQENREPTYHPYTLGHLAIHSGHFLHQIAPMKAMGTDDRRITLQGHAVPTGEQWILYW